VHRDGSPQNVLVGTDGVARVLDFGVAKARGRLQTTHDGRIKGKLAYMAPEQLRSRSCDRRSDVFAAGIVLWEALTGKRLFTADTEGEVVEKVLHADLSAPGSAVPELGTSFDAVTMRALSRTPDERFGTARDMAAALEACVRPATAADVGVWVESLAREALLEKHASIQAIESAPTLPARGEAVVETMAAARDSRTDDVTRPEIASGSQVSQPNLAMSTPSQRKARPLKRGALVVVGIVTLAGATLAALLVRPAPPSSGVTLPATTASPVPPTVASPATSTPAPADLAPSGSSTAAPSPSQSAAAAPSARPAPAPAARTARPVDCTDPFTRDELGRKIYKMECLH
jgi:serine/threonine protein kinase